MSNTGITFFFMMLVVFYLNCKKNIEHKDTKARRKTCFDFYSLCLRVQIIFIKPKNTKAKAVSRLYAFVFNIGNIIVSKLLPLRIFECRQCNLPQPIHCFSSNSNRKPLQMVWFLVILSKPIVRSFYLLLRIF
jgi:hypothetical protein